GRRGQHAGGEDVLMRERHAQQRARGTGCSTLVRNLRLCERMLGVDGEPCAQMFVSRNPRQQMFRDLRAGDLLRGQRATELGHAHLMQGLHSMTLGTRYSPSSTSGGLRWLSARWSASVTTSSRRRSATSVTAVSGVYSGSMPEV